jgi:predicted ATPase
MLTQLELAHFKCFKRLTLPLGPLTLLSGANASGKSSVLHALALLNQTLSDHEWSRRLILNGAAFNTGTVADVVDKLYGRRTIAIGVRSPNASVEWLFDGARDEMSMAVERVSVNGRPVRRSAKLRYLLPMSAPAAAAAVAERLKGLTYVTAERLGPREIYRLEDRQVATVVGACGQHTVSVLHWGRDWKVLPELVQSDAPPTLMRQVEVRMRTLFPGFGMALQEVPGANALTLGIRTSDATSFHRPSNVGFGLTQVLPIVVAALAAAKDDIVLIENPEVHLHPAGQAEMGRFLATVAGAGIQVVVETHSDHVLNGVRRAARAKEISSESVCIHFMRPREAEGSQVESPTLRPDGSISRWPTGFFDQFDRDASFFAGWSE